MSESDKRKDLNVAQYISSLDESLADDAKKIVELMQKISGQSPILYGIGTIGFGEYKYHYKSGRKGQAHILAFYPRQGKITIYLMDGTARYAALLSKLGKHSTTGYCIYIKQIEDIDFEVLKEILTQSHDHIMRKTQSGPIDSILWQTED